MTLPVGFVVRMRGDQVLKLFGHCCNFIHTKGGAVINWLWRHCCACVCDFSKEGQNGHLSLCMWESRGRVGNLDGGEEMRT